MNANNTIVAEGKKKKKQKFNMFDQPMTQNNAEPEIAFWKNSFEPITNEDQESGAFLTPYSEQDQLTELLDDTSPNIPMATLSNTQKKSVSDLSKQNTLVIQGKNISTMTGRGKNWDQSTAPMNMTKTSLYEIMPNNAGKSSKGVAMDDAGMSERCTGMSNAWTGNHIQTIDGNNSRLQGKSIVAKSEWSTTRPNLRVVEGTASSIQLKVDKSKGVSIDKPKESPKPLEAASSGTPEPKTLTPTPGAGESNPKPSVQENKPQPQPSGFQGRMTASSFMRKQCAPIQSVLCDPYSYPKGIPKSFLKPEHVLAPLYTTVQPQQPSQGPVWEANLREDHSPYTQQTQQPTWNTQVATEQNLQGYSNQQYSEPGPQELGYTGQESSQGSSQGLGQAGLGQIEVETDIIDQEPQQYSPSDVYETGNSMNDVEEERQESQSPDSQTGTKRLSAFKRLGPVTQPKKPKLTINLLCNKDQSVREVVDQSEDVDDKYTPVHLKSNIQTSIDETVMKYLVFWPWKKTMPRPRRILTARQSKSAMLLELEQMDEAYDKDSAFFQILITGYPPSWNKEDVLDAVLESVKGKSFIPSFIEFSKTECKFLVIRSKAALTAIHKYGFVIHRGDVELQISILQIALSVNQLEFIPRIVLRKRLLMAMEAETELNMREFTTKSDISHFIYFPLNRVANQSELVQLQSSVPWEFLTKIYLSHNRITTLSGFNLVHTTPRLKHLDLSYNYIDKVTVLLQCRALPLTSIALEGNPLCTDYIEQDRYIKVLKMMFPELKEIDGVRLPIPGDIPEYKRNYCPADAQHVVEKVLEVMFPLLEAAVDERQTIEALYDTNAVMTVTFMYKLRYGPIFKDYRSLFNRARVLDEGDMESIEGAPAIAKLINRWPILQHDPMTFTVDVVYHSETTTIVRISGILKITVETLAEDEHLLSFTRTVVLHTNDGAEYKIANEMLYWDVPDQESARQAFRMTTVMSKNLNLKLESPPDEDLKEKLLEIFMKLTEMEREPSIRCLEMKEWHLRNALEYFYKLLKLDSLESLVEKPSSERVISF